MTLAQVVYNISTDSDFANQWRVDPEGALAVKGFKLSKEELAFLSTGLKNVDEKKVRMSDMAMLATSWMG